MTLASKAARTKGLGSVSLKPATVSKAASSAESAMMGTEATPSSRSSSRMVRVARTPSRMGICTSISTRA